MREIKFRAWDKDLNTMHYGAFSVDGGGYGVIDAGWREWSDKHGKAVGGTNCELMQYTGIKDKWGVEIYEGDILKSQWERESDIAVVEWGVYCDDEYVGNVECWIADKWPVSDNGGLFSVELHTNEVIGNIWEHGYLLDKKEVR